MSIALSDRSIAAVFARQAQCAPDAEALLGLHTSFSYAELHGLVCSIAATLTAQGVEAGDHVAILATRSIGGIAAMLGCLHVGAVYVPMDPTFAPEQLAFIRHDVPFKAALTTQDWQAEADSLFGDQPVLTVDDMTLAETQTEPVRLTPDHPACILYTSGTTGRPKGVVIPHRAIVAMACDQPELALRPEDVVLSAATIACDGALAETLVPLMSGAAVALVETATPEINAVAETMIRNKVTVALWYAGLHHLMIAHRPDAFATVRISEQGGDVMSVPLARKLKAAWPDLRLFNGFGPTETVVRSVLHEVTEADLASDAIPIGQAMTGEDLLLLDASQNLVPDGETGELAIGGSGVALGYFNRPDETVRRFIEDPRPGQSGRIYLTGDLAFRDENGLLHFVGRADRQVKMAGRRVELDGIEAILKDLDAIDDAAVELVTDAKGAKCLVAFVTTAHPVADEAAFLADVRATTSDQIARDVFPREIFLRDSLPLTQAGKIDRKTLRSSIAASEETSDAGDQTTIRAQIAAIWQDILGKGPADQDTFFDLGGTSLQLIDAHARIESKLGRTFPIAEMFEQPRFGDIVEQLTKKTVATEPKPSKARQNGADDHAVAIVGMAARLPQGVKLDELWDVIKTGQSLIERFDLSEAEDAVDPMVRATDAYVPARSMLPDVDMFDAKFFDMRPREAALTDPQGRLFLEICQEALDNAGIDPDRTQAAIGVYAGAPMSTYMLENILADRDKLRAFTSGFQIDYEVLAGNDSSDLATRVAFKLGLKGPAISLNTACSTSLVAVAEACKALRTGDAYAVLAGGISITFPQKRGYMYMESGMASSDGLCRPFDAEASGTVFGHGGGVIVLKRLADAQRDGDHIHAVIRGVGLNNDGADKMSYTAPTVKGQAAAISAAHRDAGLAPSEIGYVECHGTGTPLGDPIEVAGLAQAFGATDHRCALGAVKGNLGHLDAAAGVMGVIKTALVLTHKTIPPVAHFQRLNDRIAIDETPFWIPAKAQPWESDGIRCAGVSSFGVGGTNAHIVMQEAHDTGVADLNRNRIQILALSAKTPEALTAMANDLATSLKNRPQIDLANVAFTLQQGRRQFDHRLSVAASSPEEAANLLYKVTGPQNVRQEGRPDVVFLFPGQGAQYPGMGSDLYETEPSYARWINQGNEILAPIIGCAIRPLLLGQDLGPEDAAAALRETRLTQPALFLTEYALGRLWEARGIRADAFIGHSVGEFAAAALAGIMSFEDALRLIARRGQLMQDQPPGSMLSVRAAFSDLEAHLDDTVDLAARNAPKLQVVAGPDAAIDALADRLNAAGIACQRLHTSHAFHSKSMDPVSLSLKTAAQAITLRAPDRPIYSTVTGEILTNEEAMDPNYWAAQARACVNFQWAVTAATQDLSPMFVEIGPGRALSTCAAQSLDRDSHRGTVQSLPDHTRPVSDQQSLAASAGALWSAGVDVDFARWSTSGQRKIPLPSYAFQRQRCWIDPPEASVTAPAQPFPLPVPETPVMTSQPIAAPDRKDRLKAELCALMTDMSGDEIGAAEADASFVELGFDSLFLGQVSQEIGRTFGVQIGFRKMLSDVTTVTALAAYLDAEMPAEEPVAAPTNAATPAPTAAVSQPIPAMPVATDAPAASSLVQAQLQTMQAIFAQQLQALGQAPVAPPQQVAQPTAPLVPASAQAPKDTAAPLDPSPAKPFKFGRGPSVTGGELTDAQLSFVKDLATRYSEKHAKSKTYTAEYRNVLADPRTAAGFRQDWKELTFPIVAERSKGAFIHDLDGNTFIDLVNGFGQTAFGHSPDFVIDAVNEQMKKGFPIGPQADLAGPVAAKFAQAVGHERVTFCNTGSEAVMAAMRVARTVTGRDTIVVFDRDYHGQFDEVLVKGKASGASPDPLPIAPGIPRSGLKNMKVLPYGGDAATNWIRDNINDIAAVIVEPVQSRHPEHRPEDFVRDLRQITREGGAALVIDEVVTGFRTGPRGMQGVWGIQGDMATYGKVVGGGMPIGVLAGDAAFMDALDGGAWQFGDDSQPEAMPTFFAGTFVRHPLVLAAVDATLDHMAAQGDELWVASAERTAKVASQLSAIMTSRGLPDMIETYSSWFVINATEADPRATLLYPLMRMEGLHVMDGFCCFLTTEHGEAECEKIVVGFEKALDALLAAGILTELQSDTPAQPKAPASQDIPLTPSQREIWMGHQLGGMAAAAFNESGSLDLQGALNMTALQTAWSEMIARHDSLRLQFAKDGSTFQVTDRKPPKLKTIDLSGDLDPQEALDDLIAEDGAVPFDITADLPIRGLVAKLSDDHHVLVLTAHHIVADGWSFGVMLADFADTYSAACAGADVNLPAAQSFAQYAQTEDTKGTSAAIRTFWQEMHTPAPALPDLPSDRPRPDQRSYAGGTVFYEVPGDVVSAAKKSGAKNGCTPFATTFTAMQVLVHRLTGARDFAIGVPTAAQQNLDNPELVGHCVNFLPIRTGMPEGATIADCLTSARDTLNAALDHQDTTFGDIVAGLDLPRTLNRLPLTEIEFNLEQDKPLEEMTGLQIAFRPNAKRAVNFDLFFNVVETAAGLRVEAHYNADLYDAERVQSWAQAYQAILAAIAVTTGQPADAVSLLSAAEQSQLTKETEATNDYDHTATLVDLVAETTAKYPIKAAITADGATWTYAELAARSDALAALIQSRVTGQGARIAMCMPRGADMLASLLAIHKAGHAYVPLDPNQPQARLQQIAETAKISAILTDEVDTAAFANNAYPLILSGDAQSGTVPKPVEASAEDAAYVIFTSGSTGVPKGVAVPHRALVNFLTSMAQAPGFTPDDKILAVTTVMFDIAALELFLPLTVGGQLEIAPTETVVDGFKLADRLRQGDITMMQATPTLWDMALTAGLKVSPAFKALCGGEALPRDLADRLIASGCDLWNMYGPTETTIWSAIKNLKAGDPITIGQPIANTGLHILDTAGQLVPNGTVGELNISGDGLALGYFERDDLTNKAFRDVQIGDRTKKLYATGDLARRNPDGEIEVLGRIDTQVKLRGFRIELGEIETRLRAVDGIAQAAVDLRKRGNGDAQLVGYLVPSEGITPDTALIAQTLAADLPDYMVPRAWVTLSALPQTGNGKLDRKALPEPDQTDSGARRRDVTAPETETEKRIAAIWEKVLGVENISVTDTLQALGIDSLALFRIASHMLNDGLGLEAKHMFAHPTIRALATFHDGRDTTDNRAKRPSLKDYRAGAQRRQPTSGAAR